MSDRRGEMRATPRNALMGYVADALSGANNYAQRKDPRMPGGLANPVAGLLSNALSVPALATTADRMSYGEPLTNARKANVPWLKPETADALMMAPLSPRNALAAASMGLGMADNGAMRAATVWHGTPHKFDKFDASKIGTGEGAQAYGHGLYLAESPAVAKEYATKLSSAGLARNTLSQSGGDLDGAIAAATKSVSNYRALIANGGGGDPQRAQGMLSLAEKKLGDLQAMKAGTLDEAGSLYKVDLPDDQIAKMLDWDKPLSQQAPVVQSAFPLTHDAAKEMSRQAREIRRQVEALYDVDPAAALALHKKATSLDARRGAIGQGTSTGGELYRNLINRNPQEAADMLRQLGIPGIRYLDGGSRSAGQGSSNFVVFPGNESMLSILERNGQPIKAPNQRGAK